MNYPKLEKVSEIHPNLRSSGYTQVPPGTHIWSENLVFRTSRMRQVGDFPFQENPSDVTNPSCISVVCSFLSSSFPSKVSVSVQTGTILVT